MDPINYIFDILSAVASVALVIVLIRSSKALSGAFFKKYYNLMIVAAVAFGASFIIEVAGGMLGIGHETIELIHHIALVAGVSVLVYASVVLPKEAVKVSEVVKTLT